TGDGVVPQIGERHLTAGSLTARFAADEWGLTFEEGGRVVTSSIPRSIAHVTGPDGEAYVHEQLTLEVGESVYGLGEQFGPFVKNGQPVEIWNEDGGTCSDLAYKNVPFYLSSRGYGVFVDDPGRVSFEVASEVVSRVQFSVPREELSYMVIAGPTPKDVLGRYTALTGRPPAVPAWSYGTWLSTSFTTNYDEETVLSFVDGMLERNLPLSVFHFDCFWMRGFHWSDFVWDPDTFPDPEGLIAKLHERGLKVCAWINPYIAQQGYMFDEGMERGFLVKRPDGSVWQWDMWQSGMALVDFTNPEATEWYVEKLRALLGQGVDCFKTDFGERIPTDVVYHDGADPERMHNYYTHLYNKAVFDLLVEERGEGEAVLFARSATAGGQQYPVHWGGDNESTYVSMAETLRGGLSLAASGFGYWSHDIGGFEGTPDPTVFKRWSAFGLLSSHSRFHGSGSYRVPWAFDDEAVEVVRTFSHLKARLMPYLAAAQRDVVERGIPMMRPMVLEFPEDRTAQLVDTLYMLGPDILVAPVFSESGEVAVYIPEGTWTDLVTGGQVTGPRWVTETRDVMSLPLYVRPGAVIPWGGREDRPDYDYREGLTLRAFGVTEGATVEVPRGTTVGGGVVVVDVVTEGGLRATVRGTGEAIEIEDVGGAK
nr:alpha-xylosidase [Actinomycetales bacterium]